MRQRHCQNHCSACGSHFTSVTAFDAHRHGPFDGDRICWPEHDLPLRPATEDGACDLTATFHEGITIWEHGPQVDKVREAFRPRTEIPSSLEEAA